MGVTLELKSEQIETPPSNDQNANDSKYAITKDTQFDDQKQAAEIDQNPEPVPEPISEPKIEQKPTSPSNDFKPEPIAILAAAQPLEAKANASNAKIPEAIDTPKSTKKISKNKSPKTPKSPKIKRKNST